MAPAYAFVTLITSDAYLPGALALAGALRDVHATKSSEPEVEYETVCLVTPQTVDVSSIKLLRRAFDVVVGVEVIAQEDTAGLTLLGRLDLNTVLTKLHAFRLEQYKKIIFLDADTLPIQPISHLFHLPHEFAAAPDVGWPDIFNSGVLVFSPGESKFNDLMALFKTRGSWDGGDQGLLNEWRGGNWHRLSFTYNTTPTAAYTYAPAYTRFGSAISVLHFIGANKPWHGMKSRAAGVNNSGSVLGSQPAYDYEGLVDRWYAVYDKHYRADALAQPRKFEVKHYDAVWNAAPSAVTRVQAVAPAAGGAMSLDELRRIAVEGMGAAGWGGEGAYRTMPLEGRLDLVRPEDREQTPKEPEPIREISAPFDSSQSLPATPRSPEHHVIELPPVSTPQPESHNRVSNIPHYPQPPARSPSPSPPMVSWNPSVDPPPTVMTVSNFPATTYFPNVWDPANNSQNYPTVPPDSSALFSPPPNPDIPADLLRQGHYRQVTGETDGSSPSPDRGKVKPVFPWERKARHAAARVFPQSDEAPPNIIYKETMPEDTPSGSPDAPPSQQLSPSAALSPPAAVSPVLGFPSTMSFTNAWDGVPSITRYANRLSKPRSPTTRLASPFEGPLHRRRRGSRDVRPEAQSSDGGEGDDEDEGESEAESEPVQHGRYRGRGVQTIKRKKRSQGTQSISPDEDNVRFRAARTVRDVAVGTETEFLPANGPPRQRSGVLSPREARSPFPVSPASSKPASPITQGTPRTYATTIVMSPETPPSKPHRVRDLSSDSLVTSTGSPESSLAPLSPPDAHPLLPSKKIGGRVWDPARGVELFKRGSEEVLARFLKMGSWEEDGVTQSPSVVE